MSVIKSFVAKFLFKKRGAIANNKAVEFSARDIEQRLRKFNIDPNTIKSEGELKQALNFVQRAEDQAFTDRFGSMLQGSRFGKSADILDMTGKKLDPNKGIMGGTQTTEETIKENLMKTDNPFSDLVKTTEKGPKTLKEREAEILERMNRENKEAAERIRKRQKERMDDMKEIEDPEDMAKGGRAGYAKGIGPLLRFLNENNPAQAYSKYLKSVKDRMKAGKEAEVAGEVIPIAGTGALITNQLKKKLKAMNEEEKKRIEKEVKEELKKDMEKRANGGRAGFIGGGIAKGLAQQIIKKYKGKIDDKLLNQMLADDNPQRLAEVMATIDEALIMQNKGMGPDEIVGTIKSSLDRKKQATGGRAGFDMGGAPSIKYDFGPDMEPGEVPVFETDKVEDAIREILKRRIRIEGAQIPISEKGQLGVAMPRLDTVGAGGLFNLLGGELEVGGMKDFGSGREKLGFEFRKKFGPGAKGKRVNRKEGGGMSRRTFMKILGGLAAIPIVGKILKPIKIGKTVSKVPVIKTAPVAGKPEWFDSLVNKVIVEGDDVTKKFATGERQSIHQKTLDDGSVVRVTEEVDNGAIRVEYESSENVFGDPVQMEYKKPLPDEAAPNPAAEFDVAESGPVSRQSGPDDFDIEIDEVGGASIKDLDSDVSKLKEYATGQKPTMKELVQNIKRRDKAARITDDPEAQMDSIISRQGDYDYASGGIAGMLGE